MSAWLLVVFLRLPSGELFPQAEVVDDWFACRQAAATMAVRNPRVVRAGCFRIHIT